MNYIFTDAQNIFPQGTLSQYVRGYGVPYDSPKAAANAMFMEHLAYGFPGSRLAYHILIDFNGQLIGKFADEVAWNINDFLKNRGLSFVQAVHHTKNAGTILAPHVHVILSTIYVDGFYRGRKYHIDKAELAEYKLSANKVLVEYGLPPILMKY